MCGNSAKLLFYCEVCAATFRSRKGIYLRSLSMVFLLFRELRSLQFTNTTDETPAVIGVTIFRCYREYQRSEHRMFYSRSGKSAFYRNGKEWFNWNINTSRHHHIDNHYLYNDSSHWIHVSCLNREFPEY